jgi:hypothetical protein
MAKNDLSICTGTHHAQVLPQTVALAALDFIQNIACPAVSLDLPKCHPNFIIYMDQTPVYFLMHPTKSVDKIGTWTVNIHIAKNARQRATVAVGFTVSVKVIIIPPGCTLLMQPVNISYNKPFKGLIRNKY